MHRRTITVPIAALITLLSCRDRPGTPLSSAAAGGDTEGIRTLIVQSADVNLKDRDGNTALIWAAREGQLAAITALVRKGADPNLPGGRNDWTPLMHAIHKNQKDAVQALLDGGADPNAKTKPGFTALMMAAGYGNAEMVRALLNRGADPYAEDSSGVSALMLAVSGVPDIDKFTLGQCQAGAVRALLEKAPNLKLKGNFWGRLALRIARWGGCSEVAGLVG